MSKKKKQRTRAPIRADNQPSLLAPPRPMCPYCGGISALTNGAAIYRRRPDLAKKPIYICERDQAWVGCHPGTLKPLGRLANKALREAKQSAHAAFDPLWKAKMRRDDCSQGDARRAGYRWLSEQLGIAWEDTHIGEFDVEQCDRVVEICAKISSRGIVPEESRENHP